MVKQVGALLLFLTKRLFHNKRLILFLLIAPLFILLVEIFFIQKEEMFEIGIYATPEDEFSQQFVERLLENDENVLFLPYLTIEELEEDIQTNKIDAGYILQEDLQEKILKKQWNKQIITYKASDFLMLPLVNEVFVKYFFEYCSEQWYAGYIAEHELFYDIDEAYLQELIKETITEQKMGDETFRLEIVVGDEPMYVESEQSVLPLRSMLALFIFFVGILSLFDVIKDVNMGAFIRLKCTMYARIYDIVTPVIIASLGALLCLFFMGQLQGVVELLQMAQYVILVSLWCGIFSFIIKKETVLLMILPVLLIGSILITPIFIDLGSIYSMIQLVQKCFPMYYYL